MRITKILKVFMLFSLLLLLLPTTLVEAKGKPVLGVSNVYEDRARSVDIGVFIHSDEKIAGGSFDLEYDRNLLRVRDADVNMGDQLDNYLSSVNGAEAGKVSLSFAKETGETFDGTLLTFKGTVLKAGETVNLKFKNVYFYNEKGTKIDVQLLDGQIKPFSGETKTHATTEALNKVWTITLSKPFNPATLNEHTVQVKNSSGKLIEVIVKPKNDTSFTVTPKSNYTRGTYTLEITDQLRSSNGSKLNKPIRHVFKVQ